MTKTDFEQGLRKALTEIKYGDALDCYENPKTSLDLDIPAISEHKIVDKKDHKDKQFTEPLPIKYTKKTRSITAKENAETFKKIGQDLMDLYHEPTMDLLTEMLETVTNIKGGRSLDVACGVGNLTKDLLKNWSHY